MNSIPKGYIPVRDVYPDAQWNTEDKTITTTDGKKMYKDSDYMLFGDKAYFKPQADNSIHTRTLFPEAQWNPNDKTITTNAGTIMPNQYSLNSSGQSFIDPNTAASMVNTTNQQNSQLTPEKFNSLYGTAKQIYQPLQTDSLDRLTRLVDRINSALTGQLGIVNAGGDRARLQYEQQRDKAIQESGANARARGIQTSGVQSAIEQGIYGEYAPWFSQLENELQAQRSNLASGASADLAEVASQAGTLEANYGKQIGEATVGLFNQENVNNQQGFENLMKIIGNVNTQKATEQQNLQQQALTQSQLTGQISTPEAAQYLGLDPNTTNVTIDGRKMNLEELYYNQSENQRVIDNAWTETNVMGQVMTDEASKVLGIAKDAPTAARKQAVEQLQYNYWSTEAQIAEQRYATDTNFAADMARLQEDRNQFGQTMGLQKAKLALDSAASKDDTIAKDLQMWEITGVAPDSEALKKYGISKGTPYPYEGTLSDAQQLEAKNKAVKYYQTQYGLTDNEASAYYEITQGVTTQEASKIMVANKDNLIEALGGGKSGETSYNRIWQNVGFSNDYGSSANLPAETPNSAQSNSQVVSGDGAIAPPYNSLVNPGYYNK